MEIASLCERGMTSLLVEIVEDEETLVFYC
jgi:hypothetical protein